MPVRPEHDKDAGFFSVVAITYFPDRGYTKTLAINFMLRSTAYEQCDTLQDQMDADCLPVRVYVFDKDGVAIRVGRQANAPSDYFFSKYDAPRRERHATHK